MRKPAEKHDSQDNPYGLIGKIYEGNKKSYQSRLLSIYFGSALIVTFLVLVSLAPQVGERFGNLAVKKQMQQSFASGRNVPTLSLKIIPWPKTYQALIATLMEQTIKFEKTGSVVGARQNSDLAQALQVSGIDLNKNIGYYSAARVISQLKNTMANQKIPEVIWRPLVDSLARLDVIQKSYAQYGMGATLIWSSTNVNSCFASGGWSGQKPLVGTENVNPERTTTYFLRCTGDSAVVKSATITVNSPAPTGQK